MRAEPSVLFCSSAAVPPAEWIFPVLSLVGITQFSSFNMIEWQYLFAAALLATVPVVILFMLIEKHLAAGLTAGGVKG